LKLWHAAGIQDMSNVSPDVSKPDKFVMDKNESLKNPFIIKEDPQKFGFDWLEAILREAK
jgi:hypothetical protein